MITIQFEDHGQDFLEWDIDKGVVVDCRPFQGSVWCGAKVKNKNFRVGGFARVETLRAGTLTVKYPLTAVTDHTKQKRNRK